MKATFTFGTYRVDNAFIVSQIAVVSTARVSTLHQTLKCLRAGKCPSSVLQINNMNEK